MTQRTAPEWLNDLRAGGDRQALALEDLRAVILRGLPYALAGKLSPDSPGFEALVEEVAQETLLRVMDHLDSFEGRSAFTTWVHKIAVREALGELRRRRWRDVPLPETHPNEADAAIPREMPDTQPGPEALTLRNDLLRRINCMLADELTDKQRQIVTGLVLQGLSVEIVASQMNLKPNAIYKLLYDARQRLKKRLHAEGLSAAQVLAVFE
jgi:RNA polymerase sigma-70 factor, ECF subfamily